MSLFAAQCPVAWPSSPCAPCLRCAASFRGGRCPSSPGVSPRLPSTPAPPPLTLENASETPDDGKGSGGVSVDIRFVYSQDSFVPAIQGEIRASVDQDRRGRPVRRGRVGQVDCGEQA